MKNNLLLGILTLIIAFALCVRFSIHADEFIISTCDFESLKSVVDDANLAGGTIRFECSGIITFSHPLILLNTIVFDGNETVIFDGDKQTHFMEIDNMATVSIDSITFQNSYSETFNATIINRNYSILNITNSIFRNNDSSAIWNREDADLNINNSQFIDNNLAKQVGKNGGAILNSLGYVNIRSSQFTNNHVIGAGGAIFIEYGNLYIFDSEFNNNSAIGSGGGAIWNSEGTVRIINNTFTNNMGSHGGAIFNSGRMNIDDTIFTNNNAIEEGGAIYNNYYLQTLNGVFTDNFAFVGGAIFNGFNSTLLVMIDFFTGNEATTDGGAIFNTSDIPSIIFHSQFNNNFSQNGGAIANDSESVINIIESAFTENSAQDNGSSIFNQVDAIATITESRFERNELINPVSRISNSYYARATNGAIYNLGIINVVDSTFLDNIPAPCLIKTNQIGHPIRQESSCRQRSPDAR